MEMRIENAMEKETELEKVDFNKFKEFILSTTDGVALIDSNDNQKIFRKKNINELFCLINSNNIKSIEYINYTMNMFLAFGATIKLTNDEIFTIESL
jgi:hypothetical protein